MNFAPVVLFVYNRPWHTRQTLEALLANAEATRTSLYVFSDAPKDVAASKAVAEVRSLIREIRGFESTTIVERESNLGLAGSIVEGVSRVCNEHGRVIVLEDDVVVSPYFLGFMNDGLNRYEEDQRVVSIHGYVYPVERALPKTFFLRAAHSWGWATWKRGWDLYNPDGQRLLDELKRQNLTHQFDFDGSYPYTKMLKQQIAGRNDSWAIRWYATAFLSGKLTLYPGRSLVRNIGMDGSGVHCSPTPAFSSRIADRPIFVGAIPVEEDLDARREIGKFLKRATPAFPVRIARRALNTLRNRNSKLK
jgi:hypothetical protein